MTHFMFIIYLTIYIIMCTDIFKINIRSKNEFKIIIKKVDLIRYFINKTFYKHNQPYYALCTLNI